MNGSDRRACTCHPSEAPQPCQHKYAFSECRRAALLKFGFDTGDYICRCADCGLQFQGAKRSWRCRQCADEAVKGRAHTEDKRAHSPFSNSENASRDPTNPFAPREYPGWMDSTPDNRRAALVEKVAEELYNVPVFGASGAVFPAWKDASPNIREHYRNEATAAIDLIRNEVLEEAAKVVDRSPAGIAAAAAIRALKSTDP
jgi:hypothetical protein